MTRLNKHRFMAWASIAAVSIVLTGCNQRDAGEAGNNTANASTPTTEPSASPTPTASIPSPAGPEMLSTVGLYEGTPLTSAKARAGTYLTRGALLNWWRSMATSGVEPEDLIFSDRLTDFRPLAERFSPLEMDGPSSGSGTEN